MSKRVFILLLFSITLFGTILRFWNYSERFGLAYDQAHDAVVARQAVVSHQLPLLGPFSSAGPFQTSGTWYWIIMFGSIFNFSSIISPWFFLTTLYVLLIIGMGKLGESIEGRNFGLLTAFFTAISTAQVAQSSNLTNQTPIAIASFLLVVSAIWHVRKKRPLSAFFVGFFTALAASIHLQGVALGIVLVVTLIVARKMSIRIALATFSGMVLPILPILIYDMNHQFVNVRNMIRYYMIDQKNISMDVLGRRWLTYVSIFWPKEWAHIIGGSYVNVILIWFIGAYVLVKEYMKKSLKKEWMILLAGLGGMIILVRYTRTPLFSSFIVFTHPFVLLLTSWIVYKIMIMRKFIGIALLLGIVILTIRSTVQELKPTINTTALYSKNVRSELKKLYPNELFSLYDWNYETSGLSVPVVLYLDEQMLSSPLGRKIGISSQKNPMILSYPAIATASFQLFDLTSSSSADLASDKWIRVDPDAIYKATELWND